MEKRTARGMATVTRKPFVGVWNIIRFNRHFYLVAIMVWTALIMSCKWLPTTYQPVVIGLTLISILAVLSSLAVSYYVYDLSGIYALNWLPDLSHKRVLNIHAGFDETSNIILAKYPNCSLEICDFYNPQKHTELSIRLARSAYPPTSGTRTVDTSYLPFSEGDFDVTVVIFSAHEIRDHAERIRFFQEISKVTSPSGQVLVTEHLRDFHNSLAYTFGVFHFFGRSTWLHTFKQAGLIVKKEVNATPFVNTFILKKNGVTY